MITKVHPTDDHVLNLLANVEGIVGDYINFFPGKDRTDISPKWLENWFTKRSAFYIHKTSQEQTQSLDFDKLVAEVLSHQVAVVKQPVTILSIFPHYFRGFRNLSVPINLQGKMVVIDGRNSSGKTSLAEAFEWLLSGQLIRRSLNDMGDSKELENCISNQLRPDGETTWVEAELLSTGGEKITVKRSLIKDYGEKKSDSAQSELYLNGSLLSSKNEYKFLDELWAGTPPVLMQHSLRTFVSSTPSQRRDYFERLLRLDEIAYIIEKTVIGDARLPEFVSTTGSIVWKEWEELKNNSQPASKKHLKKAEKLSGQQPESDIDAAIREIAKIEFSVDDPAQTLEEIRRVVENIQKQLREEGFPLLEILRPSKMVDQQLLDAFSQERTQEKWTEIDHLSLCCDQAQQASTKIGEAQLAVAQAFDGLIKAGVIVPAADAQTCPLCSFESTPTLTSERVAEISSWQPILIAAKDAKRNLGSKLSELRILLDDLAAAKKGLLPASPLDEDWNSAISNTTPQIKEAALTCKGILKACLDATDEFNESHKLLDDLLKLKEISSATIQAIGHQLTNIQLSYPIVIDKAQEYLDGFQLLDKAIGTHAREDPSYNLREIWLSISKKREELIADLYWEKAKREAQNELEKIREILLTVREKLIESRRIAFSEGMTTIWGKLRSDKFSVFSRLYIPPAKGKGLPLEIEVKAELDDGTQKKEVDALRVFSESQINILGIAAFSTRSKLLGHKLIILDDPVQSMDEDHFKTFCTELLPELLIADGQVIMLTHNDTFAREISYAAINIENYVTMKVRHSKREGCVVEEGNRRVSERLKKAEKYCEEGKCSDAWVEIRKAIERLYTVTYIKYGPSTFKPLAWLDQTAEFMWDDRQGGGVGPIIEDKMLGMGNRLKEILSMTAGGAHDKAAKGPTDIQNAIKDLRLVLTKLQVGG